MDWRSTKAVRLFALGFLTLYLELVLIRYLAGNIWNMGYFPNLVLISAFVGMGIGFTFHHHWSDRTSRIIFHCGNILLAGLLLFVFFKHPSVPGFSAWDGDFGGDIYFTATPRASLEGAIYAFIFCMLIIILIFIAISQRTARIFREFSPLTAYTLDIAGSCAGIIVFMLLSWLTAPAAVWFVLFALIYIWLLDEKAVYWLPHLALAIMMVMLAVLQDQSLLADPNFKIPPETRWSPYQKIEYIDIAQNPRRIFVNGVSHQHMEHPNTMRESFYWPIHEQREGGYKSVLILGAGSGSDVTAALMNGAEHVDAVEIDPVIAFLGKTYNPYQAYQNPKVNLVIDDGRAFMTRSKRKYDLIVFALTDSLVKVSSMSQLRLENYLFTRESVERAFGLLEEGGDIVFYNFYRQPWLKARIEELLRVVTGTPPDTIYRMGDFYVLRGRKMGAPPAIPITPNMELPTDDWPFLYLRKRGIPSIYAWSMLGLTLFVFLLMALLHWMSQKEAQKGESPFTIKLAFFLMGTAFLLLETKGVIQFSLLFGTTWINNSLVFLAVLASILAANWAATFIKNDKWTFGFLGLLVASSLFTLIIPLENLLHVESGFLRFLLASLITFSPIFFANLIFALVFREQKFAEHIFGWNLIGATLGGVAEYSSMALGYNNLAIIVALLYCVVGLAIFLWKKRDNRENLAASSSPGAS